MYFIEQQKLGSKILVVGPGAQKTFCNFVLNSSFNKYFQRLNKKIS